MFIHLKEWNFDFESFQPLARASRS
ncbi:hypothetical protein DCO46_05250 [Flavobacterium sp. HTF]|nr:hypothetical protein DCO46_05250 [Flavobacterium sp. HTF]